MDIKVNKLKLRCRATWPTSYEFSRSSGNKRLQQGAQSFSIVRLVEIEFIYEQVRSLVKSQKGWKNESKGSIKSSNHWWWRNETAEMNDPIDNDNSRKLSR